MQIEVDHLDKIDRLLDRAIIFLVPEKGSDEAAPYVEVFEDTWEISDAKAVEYEDYDKYANSFEYAFLSITNTSTRVYIDNDNNPYRYTDVSYEITEFYIELWLDEDPTNDKDNDEISYAKVYLYPDSHLLVSAKKIIPVRP